MGAADSPVCPRQAQESPDVLGWSRCRQRAEGWMRAISFPCASLAVAGAKCGFEAACISSWM